nr:epidermal patterning factor 1 [Tanacetum cinerariifolium]
MEAKNLKGMKQEEAKAEECDEGDIYDILDITVEDVVRLGQLHTPNVHTFPKPNLMVQPYVPLLPSPDEVKVVTDVEPYNDVDTPATKSILDELLEEFGDEILNITVVNEEADYNPTKDIEELERLLAKDPRSYFTDIKVDMEMTSPP